MMKNGWSSTGTVYRPGVISLGIRGAPEGVLDGRRPVGPPSLIQAWRDLTAGLMAMNDEDLQALCRHGGRTARHVVDKCMAGHQSGLYTAQE